MFSDAREVPLVLVDHWISDIFLAFGTPSDLLKTPEFFAEAPTWVFSFYFIHKRVVEDGVYLCDTGMRTVDQRLGPICRSLVVWLSRQCVRRRVRASNILVRWPQNFAPELKFQTHHGAHKMTCHQIEECSKKCLNRGSNSGPRACEKKNLILIG